MNLPSLLYLVKSFSREFVFLTSIGPLPEGEIACTVCDSGSSQPPDEIVICDKCSVGMLMFSFYCYFLFII